MHPLDSAWEKFNRGELRAREISDLVGGFAKTKPYTVVEKIEDETGDKLFVVDGKPADPPLSISTTLGEVLYNLRSSLDHVAWQLVIANGKQPIEKTSAFPLIDDPIKWDERFTRNKVSRMSDYARTLVKSVQPCFGSNPHTNEWLSWLEDLTNIDKHRHLNLVVAGVGGVMGIPPGAFVHNGPIDDGTVMARFPKAYAHMQIDGWFYEVALSEGPAIGETITSLTSALRLVTSNMLKLFGGFFPPRP